MSVDDGGRRAAMAEVDLELAQVFALLQQMGGIAVAQTMDMHGFFDAAGAQGLTEGPLERRAGHRLRRGGRPQTTVAFAGEQEPGMAMGTPDLPEQFQSALRQGYVAVTVAFARTDVQEHTFGIDIPDFQLESLPQAQATGIDRGQGHPMIQEQNLADNRAHFGGGEDDRQFEHGRGPGKLQFRGPGASESLLPEELDGAERLGGTLPRETALCLEVDEILAKVLGAELIRRAPKVLRHLAHTRPVTLLAAGLERQQGQIFGEALQDCVGGTFFICIELLLLVDCSASPFAGLRSKSILK